MILKSKTIKLRFVNENDASFILSLRTNNTYNQYLSPVKNDIHQQKKWIKQYKKREKIIRNFIL